MGRGSARLGLSIALLVVGVTGCDNVAIVAIVDTRVFREADNRVTVDVDVRAAEQSGRSVGPYCVSLHVVPLGFDPNTPGLTSYRGQSEYVQTCAEDLHDGDTRTFRFTTARTDIAPGSPLRAQTQRGKLVEDWEAVEVP